MSHAKLNLNGINLSDIKRTQRNFTVSTTPSTPSNESPTSETVGLMCSRQCVCVLFLITVVALGISSLFNTEQTHKSFKKIGELRRMIRMKCQTRQMVTYCTTQQGDGDYIVSVGACEDVYEFNGIPFTDIATDEAGNYIVPGAFDNTLRVKNGCDGIAATLDTVKKSLDNYASAHSNPSATIERVVWVADICYTDFTLKIGEHVIYELTPVAMIKMSKLKEKVAYMYDSDVDYLKGSISISGSGCSNPISTYIRRGI